MTESPQDVHVPATARSGVFAVVVTFRPGGEVAENVRIVAAQVDHLIVVDNTEGEGARQVLGRLANEPCVTVIYNAENRGIAAALNQGIERAADLGGGWVATFDQDSRAPDGFIRELRNGGGAVQGRVAVVAPIYRDRSLGFVYSANGPIEAERRPVVDVVVAGTSGNLVNVEAWRKVGGFREDFFIDCVDFEFCLRCRRAGWRIVEVRDALLDHAQGHWRRERFLWRSPRVNDYGAERRYYQARNRLVMYGRYAMQEPRWIMRDGWGYLWDLSKLALFGVERTRKLGAIARGVWDAFTGRRARTPGAALRR